MPTILLRTLLSAMPGCALALGAADSGSHPGAPPPAASCPACAVDDAHLADDPWIAQDQRAPCPVAALPLSDQQGTLQHWGDLAGAPLVVAFIYSRCANPSKCPRTTAAMAALARAIASAGVHGVRCAIATYDPAYDTPERLAAWTRSQGVTPDLGVLLLRPAPAALAATVSGWQLAVGYQADGEVATHDIELLVCDRQLRLAHRYHATIWSQDQVLADLRRLAAEPVAQPPAPPRTPPH